MIRFIIIIVSAEEEADKETKSNNANKAADVKVGPKVRVAANK